jgi:hypothetical protein
MTIDNERLCFWNEIIEKSKNTIPLKFGPPSKPQAIYAPAGKTGLKWAFAVKQHESWVELEIMLRGDKANSHKVFDALIKHKLKIEKELGTPIRWEKLPERKSCRIQTSPREPYGVKDNDKWAELQNTLIDKLKRMEKVFSPYIHNL